jgi:hypothetical protein
MTPPQLICGESEHEIATLVARMGLAMIFGYWASSLGMPYGACFATRLSPTTKELQVIMENVVERRI